MKRILIILTLFIFSCGEKIRTEITERYDDGRKKTLMKFVGEGETEQIIEKLVYSESGDTIHLENYSKDGLKQGSWISPDSSGTFLNGKKDDKWTWYHENGQISMEENYKDGKEDGKWTSYYENGQIYYEENYKDGKKDGKWTTYHENGQIWVKLNFKDGKLHGKWTWYLNGQINIEKNYKDGKLHGKLTTYHENGQIEKEQFYKDGELIETKEY